jgi:hypothetical protein
MDRLTTLVTRWVVTRPWPIIILSLVVVAAAVPGARFLNFSSTYRIYFDEDSIHLRTLEELESIFTKRDTVLFVLAPADRDVFSRENLTAVARVTEEAAQIPYSLRIDSITNFQYTHAEGDDILVEDLFADPEAMTDAEILQRKNYALTEQTLIKRLLNEQASVTGVLINVSRPGENDFLETSEVARAVRQIRDDIEAEFPGLQVHLTGTLMSDVTFAEATIGDAVTLIPLSFLFIVVTLALMLRSAAGTVLTLAVIGLSVLFSIGTFGYLRYQVNPATVAAPIIIMMTGIADCMHVLVAFFNGRRGGLNKQAAVETTLKHAVPAMLITNINNAVGFFSMNFGDVPPFRDLGNIVGVGVIAAFLLAILLLPALIMVLPLKPPPGTQRETTLFVRFGEWVIRRRKALFWGTLLIFGVSLTGIPKNELNDVFMHYFDDSFAFRRDTDFTTENLTGMYLVEYTLKASRADGIYKPQFLQEVEAFADWARSQPEVVHVDTITAMFKRVNRSAHEDQWRHYAIPEDAESAAQLLLLYEMSLPYGLDMNDMVNVDRSAVRATITTKTISSKEALAFEDRAQAWMSKNLSLVSPSQATGALMMFAHIGQENIRSMLFGTLISFVLIADVLILALGSAPFGVISLIPNLLPSLIGFGIWGYLVGEVGLSLSVVTTMTLGIVVDDTIHFLHKYLGSRREGKSAADAIRHTYREVAEATTITSVVLVLGFSVLAFSHYHLNSTMGMLTALVLAIALVLELVFMPVLLLAFEPKRAAG